MPTFPRREEDIRRAISKPCVLLVEGRDAQEFFRVLLTHLQLDNRVDVRDFGGYQQLTVNLGTFRDFAVASSAVQVESLGIIRDAEQHPASSAFQSVSHALATNGYDVPQRLGEMTIGSPKVGVFILPNQNDEGSLETLCWQAIADVDVRACVEQYLACLETTSAKLASNRDKVRVHAYLASRDDPTYKLGEGATAKAFPWESDVFEPLKQFLRKIARSDES